jgi:archaellum component FlaC
MGKFQRESDAILSDDGVTVYQVFSEDEFSVPAVALKVASERKTPVRVRLEQEVPPELAIEEIGFHPDYGEENWSIDGERMTYETELPADSETTTIYAIGGGGHRQVDTLLDGLSIESVETLESPDPSGDTVAASTDTSEEDRTGGPASAATAGAADATPEPGGSDGDAGADSSDVLMDDEKLSPDDATGGDGTAGTPESGGSDADGSAGTDDADPVETGADGESAEGSPDDAPGAGSAESGAPRTRTASGGDADDADAGDDASRDEDAGIEGDGDDATATDEDDVTGEAAGDATDDDAADAPGEDGARGVADEADDSPGQPVEPVADAEAAGEPVDAPLGAHDDAALVRELERRLGEGDLSDAARERLRESLQQAGTAGGSAVETRVEHLQRRVSDIEAFADSIQELHEEHGPPTEAFEEMHAEIETFSERLAAFDERVEAFDERVEALDDRVERIDPELESLGEDVSGLEADVTAVREDVEELDGEQEALEEEVEQLREWRQAVTRTVAGFDQS